MSTNPSFPAGEIAVICVSLSMVNEVTGNVPIVTDVAPVKPIPMRFIVVPPIVGPVFGETLVIDGHGKSKE